MTVTAKYDRAYEAWRNDRIPLAEAFADAVHGERPPEAATLQQASAWRDRWDACFHRRMNALVADAALK
ncbi:MAG: hypothetical protein ABI445_11645, partial [Polyangia bacterium]